MPLIPPPPNLKPGSRVWAYLRDSGGQAQEQSVSQQQTVLTAYCSEHGLYLERCWADAARSGTTDVGREQFAAMIATIGKERPAGLLYWSSSRLARNETDAAYYRAIIRRAGVVLHSLTEPIPEGPFAAVIEAVVDVANAESSRQNSAAVKRGQEAIFRAGFATGGFPPRGYVAVPVIIGTKRNGQPRTVDRWEPDPELWELCKTAWAMRAQGCSLREIETATGGRIYTARHSWTTFFRNETYLGIGKCGALRLPDHHPALIDRATWEAVQALEPNRREAHASFNRSPSLLSGMARCGVCGSPMIKNTSGKNKWQNYTCARRHRSVAACANSPISRAKVDGAVLGVVLGRVLANEGQALIERTQQELSDTTAIESRIAQAEKDLFICERKISNLLELAENFGSASAAARLAEREAERARITTELSAARALLIGVRAQLTPAAIRVVFAEMQAQIKSATTSGDVMALRRVISGLITRVDVSRQALTLHYSFQSLTRLGEVPPRLGIHQACFSLVVEL